jgi:hypothetical protein
MIFPAYRVQFYFHGNSDIQNSQKLDLLEITAKKFRAKIS